ncbi:MAG TPA: hypothetical protein VGX25_04460 [Actinophytocola sp.]|uniref:hypothetical protein n=1 Tax=Actinophytocola sp. TaxID=1872138 RepID=UPI002DDCE421|nr:hypothetical protein [Actinophytocola sp.]HEV2778633.1 hypothetical protein [Actinophytocola sp.]
MATIAPAPPPLSTSAPAVERWRATRWTAWLVGCVLCGGLLGLALGIAGAVRGTRPPRRRVLLVVAGVVAQLMCAGYFVVATVSAGPATCPTAARTDSSGDPWHGVRTAINAPVSGAAMLYSTVVGGQPCRVANEGITVTAVPSGYARGGTIYGTIFLTDRTSKKASARIARLSEHEARHASQWAVATLLAGPITFPALYATDESLFPGAHNHFEQQAGLADGGYAVPPDDPPAVGRLLFLVVGLVTGYLIAARRRSRKT